MWLIHTSTFKLKYFVSPETVPGGYAILSHCWDEEEQSFQDIQRIHERCTASGDAPRSYLCDKITHFCALAEQHGYEWAWADTCCIDKTSSAELSEAINSMFRYYSLAHICYAYLRDVPTEGALEEKSPMRRNRRRPEPSPFESSVWHTRGWTLQELIAPRMVIFLSQTWDVLGSKADLAHELEEVTNVPVSVLRLEASPASTSIAERMSWAAYRRTTRLEDEAYCLLGLFDINMPTLYGEGRKAFQRLQEEIMKTSSDTTLFAWGNIDIGTDEPYTGFSGLFATSPNDFRYSSSIKYMVSREVEYVEATAEVGKGISAACLPLISPFTVH